MADPQSQSDPASQSASAPEPASGVHSAAAVSFAESFHPETEFAAPAREAAKRLGLSPITPATASVLSFLTATAGARAVVEIGSGTGVSGLAIFAGMASDGVLTSIDVDGEPQREARQTFRAAGVAPNRFRLITGDALTVMPKLSDGAYDVVFVDADPLESGEYIEYSAALLRRGGVLVLNNALWHGKVADPDNEDDEAIVLREALEAMSQMTDTWTAALLPVGGGLMVASRR